MGQKRMRSDLVALEQALDASPLTRTHMIVFLLCFALNVCEGYSLQVLALAIPSIAAEWRLELDEFGMALAAVIAGKGVVGIVVGPLGDRYGRKPFLMLAGLLLAIGGLGAVMSADLAALTLWRVVSGFGLGVAIPNSMALVADFAPRRYRVVGITLLSGAMAAGTIAAGLLGPTLVSAGGWPLLFWVCGFAPLPVIVLMYFWLDESPKFLAYKYGISPRLTDLLARMKITLPGVSPDVATTQGNTDAAPAHASFWRYLPVSALYWMMAAIAGMLTALLMNWTPTMFIRAGADQAEALRSVAFINGGGFAAGLVLSLIMDRTRKLVLLVPAAASIFAVAVYLGSGGLVQPVGFTMVALLLGFALGPSFIMIGLASRIYPSSILASVIGVATAAISLGGVAGPLVGSWIIRSGFSIETSLALLAVPALTCTFVAVALHFMSRRLRRQTGK